MAADPLPPHVGGQRSIVGIGPLVVVEAGHGPADARGEDVDLAHLGRVAVADLGSRLVAGDPVRAARPPGRVARRRGPLAERDDDRRFGRQRGSGSGELEPARQHRAEHDPVPIETRDQELSATAQLDQSLADEVGHLGWRAPDRERAGRLERRMKRVGDNRQVG